MYIFDFLPLEVKREVWERGDKAILEWLDSLGKRGEQAFFDRVYGKIRVKKRRK